MIVDMHIEGIELKLVAFAVRELVFQNEIRQQKEEFDVKAFANIDVVNISAVDAANAKEIVSTGEWLGNAIISQADTELRKNGFDVIGVQIPDSDDWRFTLTAAKGERKTMGATISNLYTAE